MVLFVRVLEDHAWLSKLLCPLYSQRWQNLQRQSHSLMHRRRAMHAQFLSESMEEVEQIACDLSFHGTRRESVQFKCITCSKCFSLFPFDRWKNLVYEVNVTRSSAVTERPRNASCQSFIISYFGFRFGVQWNSVLLSLASRLSVINKINHAWPCVVRVLRSTNAADKECYK